MAKRSELIKTADFFENNEVSEYNIKTKRLIKQQLTKLLIKKPLKQSMVVKSDKINISTPFKMKVHTI